MRPPPRRLRAALLASALALLAAACATGTGAPDAPDPARSAAVSAPERTRVALERPPAPAPRERLLYLARELDPEQRAELARLAPGVELVVGLGREQALARAADVRGVDAWYATPELLAAAPRLAWVQAWSAGVDRYLGEGPLREDERVVLTNLRAVHGPAIADHAFGMLLALTRDLPVHLAGRAQGAWKRAGSGTLRPLALEGRTLLVVGLGGIGTEVARRGAGFGMRVLATRRNAAVPKPEFVERVEPPEQLGTLLAHADVVVLAVPLTPQTERLIDASALAAMKPGSFLVNVSRGKVVDTEALVEALRSGRLGGACLDVSDPEPLPPGHPLWSFPNVVITPHVASEAELTDERAWALFRENVRRFDAGEPLLNVVDKRAGY